MSLLLFFFLYHPWLCTSVPVAQLLWQQNTGPHASDQSPRNTTSIRTGWVTTPPVRGTYDILLTCVTTLSLCAWTAYHPNIPKSTRSFWTKFLRRLNWVLAAVVLPELIVLFALSQCMAAWQLHKELNKIELLAISGEVFKSPFLVSITSRIVKLTSSFFLANATPESMSTIARGMWKGPAKAKDCQCSNMALWQDDFIQFSPP